MLGNLLGALVSVAAVAWLGQGPLVIALALALTVLLGQRLRCLHPLAGGRWVKGALPYPHHWL